MFGQISAFEGGILLWIQNCLRTPAADTLVSFYTSLGNEGILFLAAIGLMLCFRRTRKAGVLALITVAVCFIFGHLLLKPLVARPRPWLDVAGLIPLIHEPDPNSFPSGHTSIAFAAAAGAWRALPARWMKVVLGVMAVLMGLSRLYVGVHYPSDVAAGALLGILCAQLVWYVNLRREKKKFA